MKPGCSLFFLLCSALTVTTTAHAQTPDTATTAPYLLAGAPTFDLSISQFREDFNSQNPSENLYASTALERGTLKIKSIQMTWLPIQGPEQKAAKAKAQEYMAAVIRTLTPLMTKTQSQKKLQSLLTAGKNKRYYTETEGALRYVVADNGEKGLTFAVEPIKLALSESLEGLNK